MASIDIFHLLNDLLPFVDILVEAKNFQTIGAEEGLQFSRAQLEERFQPCLCFGRGGFAFRGGNRGGWCGRDIIIREAGSLVWRFGASCLAHCSLI